MPDKNPESQNRQCIYVIAGQKSAAINDRVRKVFSLAKHFHTMHLVTQGPYSSEDNEIAIKPLANPTGILRVVGLNKLKRALDKIIFFPSNHILYVKAVEKNLHMRISKDIHQGLDVCVLICVPPHDLSLLGHRLKRRFPEISLLIDWQDLWSYDENYFLRVPEFYRSRLLKSEKLALNCADLNITTNWAAAAVLKEKFNIPPDRVTSIPHHYNRSDLPIAPRVSAFKSDRPVTVGFLGTLFKPPRVPGMRVVEAIQSMRRQGINIELHVHGMVSPQTKKQLENSRKDGIFLHGQAGHMESLQQITNYDFMLLLLADLPNSKIVMSIKLPHYFLTEKPILAIVPEDSVLATIIKETRAGFVIDSSTDFHAALRTVVHTYMSGDLLYQPDKETIEGYEWEHISRLWLDALQQSSRITHI